MAYDIKKYANTHKQELFKHCYAIGYLAAEILKQLTNNNVNNNLLLATFNAGCLHDIGKVMSEFQTWVSTTKKTVDIGDGQHITGPKFSYDKHARHNEVSLLLFHLLRDMSDKSVNTKNIELIEHVLYWHHAKPIRNKDFVNLQDIANKIDKNEMSIILNDAYDLINQINELSDTYKTIRFNKEPNPVRLKLTLPKYKDYNTNDELSEYQSDIKINANHSLIRSIIITADRLVSDLTVEQLDYHLENHTFPKLVEEHLQQDSNLLQHIRQCLINFNINFPNSDRNRQQAEAASQLARINEVAVLKGAAGCGKTKIALEWAYNTNAKKIIWVCPRVAVCQNIYNDLTSDAYLKKVNVEIYTGEFKYIKVNGTEIPNDNPFSGDIIITTIDQIANAILTHHHIATLLDAVNSHLIFDEYHEYINMTAYNLLFAEILQCKRICGEHTNTLLVSATPNQYFLTNLLDIHKNDCITVKTFNKSLYNIRLHYHDAEITDHSNPLFALRDKNSFVITNTVSMIQQSYLYNVNSEKALLMHGKYLISDKQDIFKKMMNSFGEHGDGSYDVLRSSHIIQASINISCDNMTTEVSHAENTLQRLGRLDRFGKNKTNDLIIAIPEDLDNYNSRCAKFLANMHMYDSTKAWIEFLGTKQLENITLDDIYSYYEDFYNQSSYKNNIEKDMIKSLKSSVNMIERNVMDPVSVPLNNTKKSNRLSKNSLRSNNRYIQMAVCEVSGNVVTQYAERYAYEEGTTDNMLTMDYNRIVGYDDSNKNLLAHMHKKHHKYKGGRASRKDYLIADAARNALAPIYLSYTANDLAKCFEKNNPYAIFYVVHANQSVGMMETKYLTFKNIK
jgi:CRISPR-associated endonuclease/helicase Cas3